METSLSARAALQAEMISCFDLDLSEQSQRITVLKRNEAAKSWNLNLTLGLDVFSWLMQLHSNPGKH